jgi:hypothetical protein
VAYRLENNTIERRVCNNQWQPVTTEAVTITRLDFQVHHTNRNDNTSPMVTIVIEGEAGDFDTIESDFTLQTSVTQRRLDIPN